MPGELGSGSELAFFTVSQSFELTRVSWKAAEPDVLGSQVRWDMGALRARPT